ncbi:MAG TPA: tetratricopeptide repeat protein [Terracidiphilus sp.]|nr:tetratricopeptide repeat protein [Terracidiphilus sp.]
MNKVRRPRLFRWVPCLLAVALLFQANRGHALQASDEVTPEVQTLYSQAKAAQQSGDTATAVAKYRAMIKLAPHLAAAYNNLGMLYFNSHDYPHAAEVLERGLQINPKMPTASAMLGMSDFQLGQDEKAEPLLRAALKADPTDNGIEIMLAHALINLKKYNDAAEYLNDYLKRNPKDQQAWYMLGKNYLQMSEDALAKVQEIDPNSVVAHEIAGEIDASMHNYDLALVEYKKAIDMAPHQPGTHMHMGEAYWYIGKWQSAEAEFQSELENDPNNCIARWKLANSMLEANDSTDDALTQVNRAIEQCPNLMQARVDRARALVRLGKQTDALPDLLMAVKESPREPTIHFLLAAVYRAEGKSAEAQQEMRTYGTLQREASAAVAQQANDANAIKSTAH